MRISLISRHDALYGAPMSGKTSEEANQAILNPIDFEEVIYVNIAKEGGDIKFPTSKNMGD